MAFDDSSWRLTGQMRGYLTTVTDDHTRALAAAWIRTWDALAPQLEDALNELAYGAVDGRIRRIDVIRSTRLQAALEQTRIELDRLFGESGDLIIARLSEVVAFSGALQERLIASQLPAADRAMVAGWSRVDPGALDAIVTRTTEQITKRSFPLSDEATAAMRRELVRGVAVGANPNVTARLMVERTEGLFNGGFSRAVNIARTETLDAHRAATALADQANADVLEGWLWTCSLSTRTCPACLAKHGTLYPLDAPGPEGHQQCRCTRTPKAKSWRDLGIDLDEPESLFPDASAWFDGLSPTEQRTILGPRRFDAWTEGDYPMQDWATKRETPGWRDSWVVSPAPA